MITFKFEDDYDPENQNDKNDTNNAPNHYQE